MTTMAAQKTCFGCNKPITGDYRVESGTIFGLDKTRRVYFHLGKNGTLKYVRSQDVDSPSCFLQALLAIKESLAVQKPAELSKKPQVKKPISSEKYDAELKKIALILGNIHHNIGCNSKYSSFVHGAKART